VVGSYELSPRSQIKTETSTTFIPYKDNFIYYPEPNLNVFQKIKAIIDLDSIDPEGNELLDHDPIVGMLHLGPQTKQGSQSEEVEAVTNDLEEILRISGETGKKGKKQKGKKHKEKKLSNK
jgi:hypothetical protein